jgi:hypothetical protein
MAPARLVLTRKRTLIAFMRMDLRASPKALPLNTIALEIRIQYLNLGVGAQVFRLQQCLLQYLKNQSVQSSVKKSKRKNI